MDKFELQQFAARLNAKVAHAREMLNQAAEEASAFAKAVAALPDPSESLEDQHVRAMSTKPGEGSRLGAVEMNESIFHGLGTQPLERAVEKRLSSLGELQPKVYDAAEEAAIGRREAIARAGADKAALAEAAVGEVLKAVDEKSPQLAAALRQRQAAQAEDTGMPRLVAGPTPAEPPAQAAPTQTNDEVIREGWLQRLYGSTSIIHKYFAEKAVPGGRGAITPGDNNLYDADLTNIVLATLTKWPEGFYRNKATSGLQYLLKTPALLLTIDFHEYLSGGDEGLVLHYSPRVSDVLRVSPKKLNLKDLQAVLPILEKELLRQSMMAQNAS
jgi:hypothetical protein